MINLQGIEDKIDGVDRRLANIEGQMPLLIDLVKEHRSNHFQFNLMAWGAVITSVGAIIVAIII